MKLFDQTFYPQSTEDNFPTGNWTPSNMKSSTPWTKWNKLAMLEEAIVVWVKSWRKNYSWPSTCYMTVFKLTHSQEALEYVIEAKQILISETKMFSLLQSLAAGPQYKKKHPSPSKKNIKEVIRHWTQIALSWLAINFSKMKKGLHTSFGFWIKKEKEKKTRETTFQRR